MFQLPKKIRDDLAQYRHSLEELQRGKLHPSRFRGIRVPWGIYSHRGGKVYMTRIRVPAGLLSPSQLRALASASKRYGDGILHITTRQDIQLHNVKIEDTINVMEFLLEHNLSPRGGGGNTVRNIISCALSGVCREELFDVRVHAIALTENLLRQDTSFTLPRKFKISFSGCVKDCAGSLINDLGLLARVQDGKRGFKVFVGGGMGAHSRIGRLLEEFIPEEDLGYCTQAVKNVYYRAGDRRDKHHNRLRFLIEDIGLDEFRRLYKEELQQLKEKEHIVLRAIETAEKEAEGIEIPQIEEKEYNGFLRYSLYPQKQKGFSSIGIRIPQGDIPYEKLSALADLEKEFTGIDLRTSQNQNLFICWVKNKELHKLFLRLKEILNDFLYPETLLDVVACKGALTCNLGLCNSPALAKEIEERLKEEFIGKKVFNNLEIKLNGCPNACGHQPIGKLSFHGLVRRVDNRPVPFYKFLLGGRKETEKTRLAEEIETIPARNIPEFLSEFLREAEGRIKDNEDIYKFLENEAKMIAKKIARKYLYVPPHTEDKDFYIDWGKKEEFSLDGLGPGECGAGVLDMIEADLTDAKLALEEARKEDYSYQKIIKALYFAARALLIVKGSDPRGEKEAFVQFKERFIATGIASDDYSDIESAVGALGKDAVLKERKEKLQYAERFLEHIDSLYKSMDSSFNFPKQKETSQREDKAGNTLDLKGTPCPINYVKAKLFLENLNSGDILEVLVDEGEPVNNVPKSLEADGHKVLKIDREDGFYKILVRKS